ncbi:MAG: 5-methyltetrahydropteroyltriglutamate--homocysteine S-methyltransferase [Acidobacteria bacterium]|nr:5-methyltetrahydropteroyltriglutamate--homocysteine S-methyltransferase [Acidobacteriota bacterium]
MNPPFRADHVGSLLRPERLKDARERFQNNQITKDELGAVEDEAIREVVKKQEAIGLQSITDGEFRRTFFHIDFLQRLEGVSIAGGISTKFHTRDGDIDFAPPRITVSGKLRHVQDIQTDAFRFLKSVATKTPKVTIPSPTMVHFRGGRKGIDIHAYPDLDEFFEDLAQVYREEVTSLYNAGCRYIQFDDTNLAYLCDPQLRAQAQERGDDPNQLPYAYAALINSVIDSRPKDLTVAIHLCRGNFKSAWVAEGGYEPVADALFNALHVDAYFLEYDDARSGTFEPLRFVPKDKTVVLGLVTTKVAALESASDLTQRISAAARYVPLENLCLSPQCGFASTVHGNQITEADQWAKLERILDVTRQVWGGVAV